MGTARRGVWGDRVYLGHALLGTFNPYPGGVDRGDRNMPHSCPRLESLATARIRPVAGIHQRRLWSGRKVKGATLYPGTMAIHTAVTRIGRYRNTAPARLSTTIFPPTRVSTACVLGNS